jgi:hypothetical protein
MSTAPKTILDVNSLLPVENGSVTLDADLGPVIADQLTRLTNDTPIVIENAVRSVNNNVVTVTGQADLLNVANMPVTVTATPGTEGAEVTARFVLNQWKFSRSFPNLPAFINGSTSSTATPNLLDQLILSDAAFVLTTDTGTDSVTGAALEPGLNFAAHCKPTGLIGLLGSIISGGGTVLLSGTILVPKKSELTTPMSTLPLMKFPWQASHPVPGIHLTADLGVDTTLGSALRFHQTGLRIYCPITLAWFQSNPSYSPIIAAEAKLDIPSAGMSLDVTATGLASLSNLSLFGVFEGVSLSKLAQLADVAGADDLTSHLPDDVQKALAVAGKLSLQAINIELGRNLTVNGIGVAVGIPNINTTVLTGFTLDHLLANFYISQPFGPARSLSVTLDGGVEFLGAPFDLTLNLPDVSGTAQLTSSATLPLKSLFTKIGLPAPPDLTINTMQFSAAKDGSLSFAASMAEKPSWTLDLGPVPLTVSDVTVLASRPATGAASGSFSGQIALGDELDLVFAYQTPGDFILRAELPEVRLLQLIGKLTNQKLSLPGNFDLDFTDTSVMIQKSGNDLTFLLATTMKELGTVAFEARRVSSGQSTWGFAAGIDLTAGLSAIPGLSALSSFEKIFTLNELLLVVSSFEDTNFSFPSLAAFNAPTLKTGNLKLPVQAGGVIPGLNVYAMWTLDTSSKQQQLLRKFLGLNPSMGITLQVGVNPAKDSRLYVSYNTKIKGLPLSCQFGGQIKDGQVGLFLTGKLQAMIQKHLTEFDVTLLFVPNGAFISGTMLGSITFEGLTLSNVVLAIGIDWEGIPSLGIAATLTAARFQSSLAIFFDSTEPSRSMLAGALSDLSLRDVVDTFAGHVVPSQIDDVLGKVGLVGTSSFTIDGSLASALDNLQIDAVSAAFAQNHVVLPSTSSQVLVVRGKPGQNWFITDMTNLLHYELVKTDKGIRVSLEPQFYLVPQATAIGNLRFDQGTFINTGLKVLTLDAMAKVLVKPSQGISVDGSMSRIVILTENLFSVESADGKSGPRVSAATFNQPAMQDAALRAPHFLIDGQLNFLGVKRKAYVSVSSKGFAFELAGTLIPGSTWDVKGHFNGLTDLSAGGSINVGLGTVDLGPLGKVSINTGANGALEVGVQGSKAFAHFNGQFQFIGRKFTLPTINLDVRTAQLEKLPKQVFDLVVAELKKFLGDVNQWVVLVKQGIVTGVADVGKVLNQVYHKTAQEAATLLHRAGYAADQVGNALKTGYGQTADQAAHLLRGAGYAADQVGNAMKVAYGATAQQAAQLLKGAGYAADQVGNAMKVAYGATVDQAAQLLKGAGYGFNEVANGIKSAYNATGDAAAHALKGAGYAVDQVGGFMKDVYHMGSDQVNSALKSAGYAASQVDSFVKSTFDTVTKALDPRHW